MCEPPPACAQQVNQALLYPACYSTKPPPPPCSTASTLSPTKVYGMGEARGDLLSTALGGWAAAELGYNPMSSDLGASFSSGTTNSLNLLNGEELLEGSACEWRSRVRDMIHGQGRERWGVLRCLLQNMCLA